VTGETESSRYHLKMYFVRGSGTAFVLNEQGVHEEPEIIWVLRTINYENLHREMILFSAQTKKINKEFLLVKFDHTASSLEFRKPKSLVR